METLEHSNTDMARGPAEIPAAPRARSGLSPGPMPPASACPWGGRAGWALAVFILAIVVCVVLDRPAEKILRATTWIFLLVAAATDRHGRSWKHLGRVALSVTLILIATLAASVLVGKLQQTSHALIKYYIPFVWAALLGVALPIFFPVAPRGAGLSPWGWLPRWTRWMGAVLLLFSFQATLSAATSRFTKESFEQLGAEILPYAGLFFILARSSLCAPARWWTAASRGIWGLTAAVSAAMAAVTLLSLSSPHLATRMLDLGLFRMDIDAPDTRRLQFLFGHHNRAGFFAATAIFICLAGAWGRRRWRVVGLAGAAAAAFALPFTLTRGALVAAAIGLLGFVTVGAIRKRRSALAAVLTAALLLPVAWISLPHKYQAHISKVVHRSNYQEGSQGSIAARLLLWEAARDMVSRRPGLGFGYGVENFENAARLDHPEKGPKYMSGASHAHNFWFETAAEIGVPGAGLLLLFTLLRLGGLLYAWRTATRARSPLTWMLLLWFCLEITIQIYGLTNYTLRRNLGILTYGIWAASVALVYCAAQTSPRAGKTAIINDQTEPKDG